MARGRRGASLLIALGLAGCAEIIAADDYASAPPRYHGFFQRMGGDACGRCGATQCSTSFDACMADSVCSEAIACVASEPGWLHGCSIPLDADWDLLMKASNCSLQRCSEPCNVGRIWSCAGKYPRPLPAPGVSSAAIGIRYSQGRPNFSAGPAFAGIEVRACDPPGPGCIPVAPAATTGADGRAQLEVPFGTLSGFDPHPGFDGFLELSPAAGADPPVFPTLRFFLQPPVWDILEWSTVFDQSFMLQALKSLEQQAALGVVALEVFDCAGAQPPDIRLEIEAENGAVVTPIYLGSSDNQPDPSLDRTSKLGMAVAVNVPPGIVQVTARLAGTNRVVVDRKRASVRADTLSIVWLGPDPRP
jgi:hypothetical protein